jgi:hypothetical protein
VFKKESTIIIQVYGNGSIIRMEGEIAKGGDSHFETNVFYLNGDHIECVDNGKTSSGKNKINHSIISVFRLPAKNEIYIASKYQTCAWDDTNPYVDNCETFFKVDSLKVK